MPNTDYENNIANQIQTVKAGMNGDSTPKPTADQDNILAAKQKNKGVGGTWVEKGGSILGEMTTLPVQIGGAILSGIGFPGAGKTADDYSREVRAFRNKAWGINDDEPSLVEKLWNDPGLPPPPLTSRLNIDIKKPTPPMPNAAPVVAPGKAPEPVETAAGSPMRVVKLGRRQ